MKRHNVTGFSRPGSSPSSSKNLASFGTKYQEYVLFFFSFEHNFFLLTKMILDVQIQTIKMLTVIRPLVNILSNIFLPCICLCGYFFFNIIKIILYVFYNLPFHPQMDGFPCQQTCFLSSLRCGRVYILCMYPV